MANTILEMDQLTAAAEESIKKMEQSDRVAPAVALDVGELEGV